MVCFFCKWGHANSFAMLVMFLMYATNVYEPTIFISEIKTKRNKNLRGNICWFPGWDDLHRNSLGCLEGVPFLEVLPAWKTYLEKLNPQHTWEGIQLS